MASILVVDDQKAQRKNLAFYLKSQAYDVAGAGSAAEALAKINSDYFDIVVADYKLDDMNGHELMLKARQIQPSLEFIIVTAYGTVSLAVELVRDGAADFISKPFEYATIQAAIEKVLRRRQIRVASNEHGNLAIVCQSQKMKDIIDLASKAAASDMTVLIEGDVGTGKELFARVVHQNSHRYRGKFMVLECTSGSELEIEEALFGSIKLGRDGLLSECNAGTLYLRDIESLKPKLQARLLRFLREGTFVAVDGNAAKKSNARLIAGTTKNIKGLVSNSAFREDLYYILNVMPVYIPPLRSRAQDLLPLVKHFLAKYKAKSRKNIKAIAPEVLSWMSSYDWPGNVQELENIIARACVLTTGETLDESLIFTLPQDRPFQSEEPGYLNITLKDNQKTLILKALRQNSGNFSRTAAQLGISRTTLWRRLKKFKIEGLTVEQT